MTDDAKPGLGHNSSTFAEAHARVAAFVAEQQRLAGLAPYQRLRDAINHASVHAGRLCRRHRITRKDGLTRTEGVSDTTIAVLFAVAQLSDGPNGQCFAGIEGIAAKAFRDHTDCPKEARQRRQATDAALKLLEAKGCILLDGERRQGRLAMRVVAPTQADTSPVVNRKAELSGCEPETSTSPVVNQGSAANFPGCEPETPTSPVHNRSTSPVHNRSDFPGSQPGMRDERGKERDEVSQTDGRSVADETKKNPAAPLDLNDERLPDFIEQKGRGYIAEIAYAWPDRETGKQRTGTARLHVESKHIDQLRAGLKLSDREARALLIAQLSDWHARKFAGGRDGWLSLLAEDCRKRQESDRNVAAVLARPMASSFDAKAFIAKAERTAALNRVRTYTTAQMKRMENGLPADEVQS